MVFEIHSEENLRQLETLRGGSSGTAIKSGSSSAEFRIEDLPNIWTRREHQQRKFLVDKFLIESSVSMITGPPASGKSWLALSIASAVARGDDWCGLETKQRTALYVDRENPDHELLKRMETYALTPEDAIKVWTLASTPPPMGPGASQVVEYCRNVAPLIVFDSLIAFLDGASEQDAAEMRRIMQQFRVLAAAGATVLLLHHTGKAPTAQQYRGSSDIMAAVDLAFVVEPLQESSGLTRLRLKNFKNRSGPPEDVFLNFEDGFFERSNDPNLVEGTRALEILDSVISGKPGIVVRELEEALLAKGVKRSLVRAELEGLVESGRVRVERGPNNSKKYYPVAATSALMEVGEF